jgi:hypothetical protein
MVSVGANESQTKLDGPDASLGIWKAAHVQMDVCVLRKRGGYHLWLTLRPPCTSRSECELACRQPAGEGGLNIQIFLVRGGRLGGSGLRVTSLLILADHPALWS